MIQEEKFAKGDEILALCPTPYMIDAWLACFSWALGFPPIINSFREESGNKWAPGRAPIDQMIDEVTKIDLAFFLEFAAWFNENVWGDGTELDEYEEETEDERKPFA
jgi:hypothetical protein